MSKVCRRTQRQFSGQMPKPRVESIQGLSPAIAIEQKTVGSTPRSTVGTVTEVYDYLRILFARMGEMYCPKCLVPAVQQTTDQIVDSVLQLGAGAKLLSAGSHGCRSIDYHLRKCGSDCGQTGLLGFVSTARRMPSMKFRRLIIGGRIMLRWSWIGFLLAGRIRKTHLRLRNNRPKTPRATYLRRFQTAEPRIADSIEAALDLGKGIIHVAVADPTRDEPHWIQHRFSLHLSCSQCQRSFERQTPQKFSFNSPLGWCHACEGLGTEFGANQAMLVTSPERISWTARSVHGRIRRQMRRSA